ncbi:MAG: 50S ribosomal protein L30 [Bacteroidales bacterium]|nr:50S ribosomal protein L30 [Candidatus Physcocola equi]
MAKLLIRQVRSAIDCTARQKATLEALGFKKMTSTCGKPVEQEDNACVRGMIRVVSHLVQVEEVK